MKLRLKKSLSIFLAFCLIFGLVVSTASAAMSGGDNTAPPAPTGEGTCTHDNGNHYTSHHDNGHRHNDLQVKK